MEPKTLEVSSQTRLSNLDNSHISAETPMTIL